METDSNNSSNNKINKKSNNINFEKVELSDHLENHHGDTSAKYIKNIIYGGLDGIITTFSIIAAAFGANLEIKMIIIMGLANLFSDAVSMGLGEYISSFFENLYILSEKKKELHEYDHNHNYEIHEMEELLQNYGWEEEDSKTLIELYKSKPKYKELFIDRMVKMELGLDLPGEDYKKEMRNSGLITFFSFVIFGFIPVLNYLIFYFAGYEDQNTIFITNCFITGLTMISLGCYQAKISKQSIVKGGIYMFFNGFLATSIAFILGYSLEKLFY